MELNTNMANEDVGVLGKDGGVLGKDGGVLGEGDVFGEDGGVVGEGGVFCEDGGVVGDDGVLGDDGGILGKDGGVLVDGGVIGGAGGVIGGVGGVLDEDDGVIDDSVIGEDGGVIGDDGGVLDEDGGVLDDGGVIGDDGGVIGDDGEELYEDGDEVLNVDDTIDHEVGAILRLPYLAILKVFSYLGVADLVLGARPVCRLWHGLTFDRELWKVLYLNNMFGQKLTNRTFLHLLSGISSCVEEMVFGRITSLGDEAYIHDGIVLKHLKSLDLSGANFSETGLGILFQKYPGLERLVLKDIQGQESALGLCSIETLTRLKVLEIDDQALSKVGLVPNIWESLPHLQCLTITSELNFGDEDLCTLWENSHSIKKLNLTHCHYISRDGFTMMPSSIHSLVEVNLAFTGVDDVGVESIARNSPKLKQLSIEGCNFVTDIGIMHIAEHCAKLQSLVVNYEKYERGCNITNVALQQLSQGCRHLQRLIVNHCPGIHDIGIVAIATECHDLKEIGCAGCLAITDRSILAIAENCPQLQNVNLSECVQITSRSVNALVTKCRWLQSLLLETCHYLQALSFEDFLAMKSPFYEEEMKYVEMQEDLSSSSTSTIDMVQNIAMTENQSETIVTTITGNDEGTGHWSENKESDAATGTDVTTVDLSMNTHEAYRIKMDIAQIQRHPHCNTSVWDADLPRMPIHSHLRVLHLSLCSKIANDSVKQVATHCPDLQELSLRGCYLITDAAIEFLLRRCQALTILDISGGSAIQSTKLTNMSLFAIANYGLLIEELTVYKNNLLTPDGLQELLRHSVSLRRLSVGIGEPSIVSLEAVQLILDNLSNKIVTVCIISNSAQSQLGSHFVLRGNVTIELYDLPRACRAN